MSRDFWAPFFHDSNLSVPLMNRLKYFRIRFRFCWDIWSKSSKNSTPRCAWLQGVIILGLANQKNVLQIFSFMINVFPPKRISPDGPFKRNQRFKKISLLTLRCGVWLRRVMHTVELDLAVGCTPQSQTLLKIEYVRFSCFRNCNTFLLRCFEKLRN